MSISRTIAFVFNLIIFLVPLIFFPYSSELFEFNKIIIVYLGTIIIFSLWTIDMISQKKVIFARSKLDVPIIIFLFSQLISTVISIDSRTSFLGYYSRFHGGLLSSICYAVLFWAFITYMDKVKTRQFLKTLFISTGIAAVYASLEHFGLSPSCLLISGKLNV